MPEQSPKNSETVRLEKLWAGYFGDDYIERNRAASEQRGVFWNSLLEEFPVSRILEVGCNIGANLQWLAKRTAPQNVHAVDINLKALKEVRSNIPSVNAIWSPARELPYRDKWFDLVFTMGVLIHQPDDTLPLVMSEIVRCSRKYILCGEYFAEQTTEVKYREQEGALFKRDYGAIYQNLFPDLKLLKQGFLSRNEGWDDIT
ncbi:MAG: methyltransferase domain-containing protein [FCB group bacterium]|nr:methyltransferase domain-containing protein [FCB group bacterium]